MTLSVCQFAMSCAADQQTAQQASPTGTKTMKAPEAWAGAKPMAPAPRKEVPQPDSRRPANASSASKREATNVPPKDAQFTLYCADYTGPAHVELAKRVKEELAQQTGLRGWYIVHQSDRSTLFYGYYKEIDDANMRRDRLAIESLEDRSGNRIVRAAIAVPVDAPDPDAPPEWNLANVRRGELDTRHFWTLQIGAYKDSPQRKQVAVEAVREARKAGVDAYYYHGESVSSVCIGVWPMEALRIEGMELQRGARDINSGSSIRAPSSDPDQALLVAPGINVPESLKSVAARRNVSVAQPKVEVVDSSLIAMKRQFPDHAINGMVEMTMNERGQQVAPPSLVVQIPLGEPNSAVFNPPTPEPSPAAIRALQPDSTPASSGGGKLKSIGK
jgi:hypothetical protein